MNYIYFSSITNPILFQNKIDKLNFISDHSYIPYKNFLFSSATHLNKNIFSIIPKDKSTIIGDSGGFQIMSGVMKYDDKIRDKIFNWLENNTHYAMNLDIPPVGISFEDSYIQSKENFKYFESKQTGKTRFIKVIHGNNINELKKWIDMIFPMNFNGGYSLGGLVGNYNADYKIFLTICLLYQNNIFENMLEDEIFHILGVSSFKRIIPVFYFFHRLKDMKFRLTFDNSTVEADSLKRRMFYVSLYPKKIILRQKDNIHIDVCNCPVCKDIELSKLQSDTDVLNRRLYAHNHLKYINDLETLYKLTKLDKKILNDCMPEYQDIFDLLDEILNNKEDCVNILNKYKFLFKGDNLPNDNIDIDELF